MAKIAQVIALCALMALSTDARSVRALRQTGGGRHLQTTIADTSKSFEQLYFSETMGMNSTVILLDAGPFKLEASCKTIVVQNTYSSWYSSYYPSSSYDFGPSDDYSYYYEDAYTWDPNGNYSSSFLALDLTYTAPEADYVYGPPNWWYHHPNETMLLGSWEAGESRTSTIFRGYTGSWGDDFTLQSLSGNYIGVDGGDTIGIHKEYTTGIPGGMEFPAGIECMVAGFLTYHIPAIHDAA